MSKKRANFLLILKALIFKEKEGLSHFLHIHYPISFRNTLAFIISFNVSYLHILTAFQVPMPERLAF